jgi:GNAT superfamily N-acetyltransferase
MAADHAALADGSMVLVRPIEPADRGLLVGAFERLSPEARYRRFFSPVSRLTERQLDYLTQVDHHSHEALVAVDEASGRLVGVARFVRTGAGEAEPAMVVADDWQGRGVASALLDRLVERALDEGVRGFRAPVLAGNTEAVRVLRRLGDTTVAHRGTELELTIALHEGPPRSEGLHGLLRAAAAGTVDPLVTFWHRLLPRQAPAGDDGPDAERENVIVCAVDPALTLEAPSVALAERLAGASGAEVVLVGAMSPLGDAGETEKRLRRLAARLGGGGVGASVELRRGDLAAVVLDVATERRARLIVVDDPGDDPGGRLLGSTWDHVSHHAPSSVLVARR